MNIVKLMVIIIYLIIGSALGIIIILKLQMILDYKTPAFKNHYVDGIIGSIFMFLIWCIY